MKKCCLYLLISLFLVSIMGSASFAAVPEKEPGIEPNSPSEQITFERESSTKATLTAIHKIGTIGDCDATYILQEASFGSSSWTDSNVPRQYASVDDALSLIGIKTFTVTNAKQYRVKIIYKDTVDGISLTTTKYSNTI